MKPVIACIALTALVGLGAVAPAAAQSAPATRTAPVEAAYTPFMLSFVTPLQVPPRDFDVGGLRISLVYGECHDFDGLDLAVVDRARGHANGLQAAGLANIVDGNGLGLQVAPVNAVKGEYDGLQIGAANYAAQAQAFQIGFYNGAQHIEGCQLGVINTTRTMIGVQIGLVNVIQDNDVPFMPIVNCYF